MLPSEAPKLKLGNPAPLVQRLREYRYVMGAELCIVG